MVELPRKLYDEIVGHSQEGWPDEICGLVAAKDDRPLTTYRVVNAAETPRTRYVMEPRAQFEAMMDLEERGMELYAIYHSHPSTQAYPSATDRGLAFYPDAVYLICSLENREQPVLRAFYIRDDEVLEQGIRISESEPGREEAEVCC